MNRHRKLEHPEILGGRGIMQNLSPDRILPGGKRLRDFPIESTGHLHRIIEAMGGEAPGDLLKVQVFSLYNWVRNDGPIYRLTEDLTMALANTEPPMDKFELDPKACVPISGMYVALPPVFFIGSSLDKKAYAVEGIYIVEDLICKDRNSPPEPGITFLGVGEDLAKGAWLGRGLDEGPCRDDTLIHFGVIRHKDIRPMVKGLNYPDDVLGIGSLMGVAELAKLAFNLLWMLQYVPHAISRTVLPDGKLKGKKDRARRREIDRMNQKGRTHRGYLLLDLSTDQRRASTGASVSGNTVRAHIVRGHIHNYWMKDPRDKKPVETKLEGGKTKYLVPKWVLPYRKGA